MKRITETLQCDTCEKEVEKQVEPELYGGSDPFADWIPADYDLHFCCAKCAGKYFATLEER